MARILPALLLTLVFGLGAQARGELADPFVNKLKVKEELWKKQLETLQALKAKKAATKRVEKPHLFRPVIPKPLEALKIEGIAGSGGTLFLVVSDPETGETYLLKEGDPIAPNEKIALIDANRGIVLIDQYMLVDGNLIKKQRFIKVNKEDR